MNIALPALVVFVILLPGFVARARFQLVERESIDYAPFGKTVTQSVLAAIALHGIWLSGAWFVFDQSLAPTALLGMLSSVPEMQATGIRVAAESWNREAAYFCSLLLTVYVLPPFLRKAIVKARLDISDESWRRHVWPFFRFDNASWYYAFSPPVGTRTSKAPDYVAVTAIVDVAGQATLYIGRLHQYFVDGDGKLDRMILRDVYRCPFDMIDADEAPFREIKCKDFFLRYADALTLSTQYVYVDDQPEPELADVEMPLPRTGPPPACTTDSR